MIDNENEIKKLNNLLNNDILNINLIKHQINKLNTYSEEQKLEYFNDLLYPEERKNARIPSKVAIPTSTFQLKSSINVSFEWGNGIIRINPFFLASTAYDKKKIESIEWNNGLIVEINTYLQKVSQCCAVNCDGEGTCAEFLWETKDLNQTIEKNIYSMYRLVSAEVRVKYVGRLAGARGTIGGGVLIKRFDNLCTIYESNPRDWPYVPGLMDVDFSLNKDPNIESIKDCCNLLYYRENNILEGLRLIYFPIDESYEKFYRIYDGSDTEQLKPVKPYYNHTEFKTSEAFYNKNFNWYIFTDGAEHCEFLIELYSNYECIPAAEVLNYIPVEIRPFCLSLDVKHKIIEDIKKECVKKINKNILEKLINDEQ